MPSSSSRPRGFQKIRQWKTLGALMNAYSLESLISALRKLSDYLMKNGVNSGNIFVKIFSFPALLTAIVLLQASLLIKRFVKNAYRILQNILKFLNMLLTILIDEVKFYWKAAYHAGCQLIESEKYLYGKMIEHCQKLWNEIFNEINTQSLHYTQRSYGALFVEIARRFGYWVGTLTLAMVMTVLLIGLPFIVPISLYLRGEKINGNHEINEISIEE